MLIPHATDQRFLCYVIASYNEGRILIHEFCESAGNLFFITLLLRITGPAVHRQREFNGLKEDGVVLVT